MKKKETITLLERMQTRSENIASLIRYLNQIDTAISMYNYIINKPWKNGEHRNCTLKIVCEIDESDEWTDTALIALTSYDLVMSILDIKSLEKEKENIEGKLKDTIDCFFS